MIKADVGKLSRLTQVFYGKALLGDVRSGLLVVRVFERLHSLLGLDTAQRIDLQIIQPPEAPSRHERLRAAIMNLRTDVPPIEPNNGNVSPLDDDGARRAFYVWPPGRGDFLVSNFHPGAIPGNLVRNDFWR